MQKQTHKRAVYVLVYVSSGIRALSSFDSSACCASVSQVRTLSEAQLGDDGQLSEAP
jgi:hypothetical protein